MFRLLKRFALGGLLICASGCATRVVVVDSQEDVVRLGKNVKGSVYVWRGGQWEKARRVTLPEGWYAGPGPKAEHP